MAKAPPGDMNDMAEKSPVTDSVTLAERYLQALVGQGHHQTGLDAGSTHQQMAAMIGQLRRNLNALSTTISDGFQTLAGNLLEAARPLTDALAPGASLGDLLRVRYEDTPQDDRAQAAFRLIRRHFTRKYVFYRARWHSGVEEAFDRDKRRQGTGYRATWETLVVAHLFDAVADLPFRDHPNGPARTVDEVYDRIRCRLKSAIERELLGHTTDSHTEEIPVEDPEEDRPVPADILERAEQRLDLLLALRRLPPDIADLLICHDVLEVNSVILARRYGLRPATVRQRLSRGRKLLAKLLPDMSH